MEEPTTRSTRLNSLHLEHESGQIAAHLLVPANLSQEEQIQLVNQHFVVLSENVDLLFQILMGSLIILMQAGFGFLEAGSVRAKNTTNILIKNYADLCFGNVKTA